MKGLQFETDLMHNRAFILTGFVHKRLSPWKRSRNLFEWI